MVFPVTVQSRAETADNPRLFAVEIVLLRTMWWPMVSLFQPLARARSIVLRTLRPVGGGVIQRSPYLPRATPEQVEWLMTLLSMIQPLLNACQSGRSARLSAEPTAWLPGSF